MIKNDLIKFAFKPQLDPLKLDIRDITEFYNFICNSIIENYKYENWDHYRIKQLKLEPTIRFWNHIINHNFHFKDIKVYGIMNCDRCSFVDKDSCNTCNKLIMFTYDIDILPPYHVSSGLGYPRKSNGWTYGQLDSIVNDYKIVLEIE